MNTFQYLVNFFGAVYEGKVDFFELDAFKLREQTPRQGFSSYAGTVGDKKYNPLRKTIKAYLSRYFLYDMLKLLCKDPSLLLKNGKEWSKAAGIYL